MKGQKETGTRKTRASLLSDPIPTHRSSDEDDITPPPRVRHPQSPPSTPLLFESDSSDDPTFHPEMAGMTEREIKKYRLQKKLEKAQQEYYTSGRDSTNAVKLTNLKFADILLRIEQRGGDFDRYMSLNTLEEMIAAIEYDGKTYIRNFIHQGKLLKAYFL